MVRYKKHTEKKVGTKALTLLDYFILGLPENKDSQSCFCSHLHLNPLCLSPIDGKKTPKPLKFCILKQLLVKSVSILLGPITVTFLSSLSAKGFKGIPCSSLDNLCS